MSEKEGPDFAMPDFGTCDVCGQMITGSHYHCSCGTSDVTSMYGHHGSVCKVATKEAGKIIHRGFHHCGPDGDCSLAAGGVQ